MVVMKRCWRN
uniref:Uncharacterized protein n=1 Tax=Rhizophora mucronata TaxID=61149 RepID=A0A2P2PDF7_RHIMU